MKEIIAACAALTALKLIKPIKAEAWCGVTHRHITAYALELLKKEGKEKQYEFFKPYEEQLEAGCTKPDRGGDVDHGAGMHYYSFCNKRGIELPATAGYYRNRRNKFSKSARTMLEENYTSALSLYKSGKPEDAMFVFARAAHFIEDMSCTPHVSNIRCFNRKRNIHNAYEEHINTICKQFNAERLDKRLIKYYENDSFEGAANRLIKASSKFVALIKTLDPIAFRDAAKATIELSQQNVAALMLKFYEDCTTDKDNYIRDGRSVMIKNVVSGMVITEENGKVFLAKPGDSKSSKLTAVIGELGAFSFVTEDGKTINKKFTSAEKTSDSTAGAAFRLAALGKRRYRIMTGASDYAKALTCSVSGRITIERFDPENALQIWAIG